MKQTNHKLGVIIPYRDRSDHLNTLIPVIEKTLTEQNIDFEIIIVEQYDFKSFNRGKLLNIGFKQAEKLNCDYVVFHDVDMIPITVDYSYSSKPVHMATHLMDGSQKRNIADNYFGGVTLFPTSIFNKINGYSNKYWGWGFEDDDLLYRYRINFDNHDTKRIPINVSESAAMEFNGHDSFIEIPKDFRLKNYTILLSFHPSEIECDDESEFDEYSIFTIPGYDTGIMYNSFKRYKFETWTRRKKNINLNSKLTPAKQTTIVVTVNQDDKIIKMYQDGILIDTIEYDYKLLSYNRKDPMYLGFADTENNKRIFYKGTISYFSIWNHSLEEGQIKSLNSNLHMGVTEKFGNYIVPHCLDVCYDMKISTNSMVYDISGNKRHGKVHNCNRVPIEQQLPYKEIIVPWRRNSKFNLLSHDENGYIDNKWKQPETRKNQIYFNNQVLKGNVDITRDGLDNLRYRVIKEHHNGKISKLEVKL